MKQGMAVCIPQFRNTCPIGVLHFTRRASCCLCWWGRHDCAVGYFDVYTDSTHNKYKKRRQGLIHLPKKPANTYTVRKYTNTEEAKAV